MMELAESDLDLLKEVATEEVARDRDGADRGLEGEAPKARVRQGKMMNSRADSEAGRGLQAHFPSSHQINAQLRYEERTIKDRKLRSGIKVSIDVDSSIDRLSERNAKFQSWKVLPRSFIDGVTEGMIVGNRSRHYKPPIR
jgi:hypothetical protein